jgi:hypothetical protein
LFDVGFLDVPGRARLWNLMDSTACNNGTGIAWEHSGSFTPIEPPPPRRMSMWKVSLLVLAGLLVSEHSLASLPGTGQTRAKVELGVLTFELTDLKLDDAVAPGVVLTHDAFMKSWASAYDPDPDATGFESTACG